MALRVAIASGAWESGTTWLAGAIPVAGDTANLATFAVTRSTTFGAGAWIIEDLTGGGSVTLTGAAVITGNLTIKSCTFTYSGGVISAGNITLDSATIGGAATFTLTAAKSFTHNGAFTDDSGCTVTINGAWLQNTSAYGIFGAWTISSTGSFLNSSDAASWTLDSFGSWTVLAGGSFNLNSPSSFGGGTFMTFAVADTATFIFYGLQLRPVTSGGGSGGVGALLGLGL